MQSIINNTVDKLKGSNIVSQMNNWPAAQTSPGAKTIKKNTKSTQNKSQTHRAKQYEVTSFLSTDCELSTDTCSKNVHSLGSMSTWRSLNRLRVQKGRCRAMMIMWKLSHRHVCDCGERQTMSHIMTCGDAPIARGRTWLFQPLPVSTVPKTGRYQSDSGYRGLDEEEA